MISLILAAVAFAPGAEAQDATKIYKKALPSVMTLEVETAEGGSIGTAFLVGKDGLAVTAHHVIEGATSAKAHFADGTVCEVSGVIDSDPGHDVAMIRVKGVGSRPIMSYTGAHPEVGAKVFTLGAPQGLSFSISDGIIAQIRKMDSFVQYQYTCPTSQGNSGGPLLDGDGKVLGVVSWIIKDAQNLNFAICWAYPKALNSALPLKKFERAPKPRTGGSGGGDDAPFTKAEMGDALFASMVIDTGNTFFMADMMKPIAEGEDDDKFVATKGTDEAIKLYDTVLELLAILDTPDKEVNKALPEISKVLKDKRNAMESMSKLMDYVRKSGWDDSADAKYKAAWEKWAKVTPWYLVQDAYSWMTKEMKGEYEKDFYDVMENSRSLAVVYEIGFMLDTRAYPKMKVGLVGYETAADKAGFHYWDEILEMDGKVFAGWVEADAYLNKERGSQVVFKVRRESGKVENVTVLVPEESDPRVLSLRQQS